MIMTDEQSPQETLYGQYAGCVTRLVAFITDQLIVTGVISLVAAVAVFIMQSLNINELIGAQEIARLIMVILALLLNTAFLVFYYIGFWILAGQTPGKRLMGLRIVRTDGERITVGPAIRRWVGYWISAILFLGYLWVLVDDRRQGFHDKLAGTLVVYSWPEQEEWERITPIRDHVSRFRERRRTSSRQAG
jgi:uncharacterized RDD family membrane protein YckC